MQNPAADYGSTGQLNNNTRFTPMIDCTEMQWLSSSSQRNDDIGKLLTFSGLHGNMKSSCWSINADEQQLMEQKMTGGVGHLHNEVKQVKRSN